MAIMDGARPDSRRMHGGLQSLISGQSGQRHSRSTSHHAARCAVRFYDATFDSQLNILRVGADRRVRPLVSMRGRLMVLTLLVIISRDSIGVSV